MTPEYVLEWLKKIETSIVCGGFSGRQTKNHIKMIFQYIRKLIKHQIPEKPINVKEVDGRYHFECPSCHTKFDSEDPPEDFNGCYICLKRWKEEEKGE